MSLSNPSIAVDPAASSTKPDSRFNAERIRHQFPSYLQAKKRWLCWRFEYRDRQGKWSKVPVNPNRPQSHGSSTDENQWVDFETAVEVVQRHAGQCDGVGYVFSSGDGIVGVDLDHCLDAEGDFLGKAGRLVEQLNTYTERSVSGDGVHAILLGALPEKGNNRKKVLDSHGFHEVEIYSTARFFVVTGDHLEQTPKRTTKAQEALDAIREELWPAKTIESVAEESHASCKTGGDPAAAKLSDQALLDKIFGSKNGEKVARIWSNDNSDYGGDASAGDLALCTVLAFWTGKDTQRMDRLFRESSRIRGKWDERHSGDGKTYGQMTITKAIEGCTEVWSSGNQSKADDTPLSEKFLDCVIPCDFVVPEGYEINKNGVFQVERGTKNSKSTDENGRDEKLRLISTTPCFIVSELQDLDERTYQLKLKIVTARGVENVIVNAEQVADRRQIIGLAAFALDVTSDIASVARRDPRPSILSVSRQTPAPPPAKISTRTTT